MGFQGSAPPPRCTRVVVRVGDWEPIPPGGRPHSLRGVRPTGEVGEVGSGSGFWAVGLGMNGG